MQFGDLLSCCMGRTRWGGGTPLVQRLDAPRVCEVLGALIPHWEGIVAAAAAPEIGHQLLLLCHRAGACESAKAEANQQSGGAPLAVCALPAIWTVLPKALEYVLKSCHFHSFHRRHTRPLLRNTFALLLLASVLLTFRCQQEA